MAAVLVVLMLAVLGGIHLWHRSTGRAPSPARSAQSPALPMLDPVAPSGIFLDRGHAWVRLTADGTVRIGIDDFLAGLIGSIDDVQLPPRGKRVARGETLFRISVQGRLLDIPSPASGEVVDRHANLESRPWVLTTDPYGLGWVVALWSQDSRSALMDLQTGPAATEFLRAELRRWRSFLRPAAGSERVRGAAARLDDDAWKAFSSEFVPKHRAASINA